MRKGSLTAISDRGKRFSVEQVTNLEAFQPHSEKICLVATATILYFFSAVAEKFPRQPDLSLLGLFIRRQPSGDAASSQALCLRYKRIPV